MKYIKLFEAFQDSVKFYRFNREDILGGEEEGVYVPKKRALWGFKEYNELLIGFGFPDREECVHFMDIKAFDGGPSSFKQIYGDWVYEIEVDEKSILGWSFCLVINDWYFDYYQRKLGDNSIVRSVRDYASGLGDIDEKEAIRLRIDYLIDNGIIGRGTLEDLRKSPFFGKESAFVWTCDPIKIKKIGGPQIAIREPRAYKSLPLLNPEDFSSKEEMARFFKENGSILKRLKDIMDVKKSDHGAVRQEALSILKKWRES